jgi:hypothetical protein
MRHISGIIAAEEKGKLARGNKVCIMNGPDNILVAQSLDFNFILLPLHEMHFYTCANKHSAFCCVNDQIFFLSHGM